MIVVKNLYHEWLNDEVVLSNINLEIKNGEIIALMGTSGSGKSTLLKIISGLITPTRGSVLIDNTVPNILNKDIGLISQTIDLLPWKTVSQNVEFGLLINNIPKVEREKITNNVLKDVSLLHKTNKYPDELSGGEYQRVGIARLLALSTLYILLDEPFTALDFATRHQIHKVLLLLIRDQKRSIILITHHLDEAVLLADRILYLSSSKKSIAYEFCIKTKRDNRILSSKESISIQKKIRKLLINDNEKLNHIT